MDFNETARTFGFAAACLVFLAIGVAVAGYWCAKYILKPGFDRHLKFLDSVQESLGSLAQSEKQNADILRDISGSRGKIIEQLDELLEETKSANVLSRSQAGLPTPPPRGGPGK